MKTSVASAMTEMRGEVLLWALARTILARLNSMAFWPCRTMRRSFSPSSRFRSRTRRTMGWGWFCPGKSF